MEMHHKYHDPNVVNNIKHATGDSIHVALDAISEVSAQKITVEAFGPSGGKVVTILPPKAEARALREDVTIQGTCSMSILAATLPPITDSLYLSPITYLNLH